MVQEKVRTYDETTYEKWMKGEGLPIHDSVAGMDHVDQLPRKPWARTGGTGAFIQMRSTVEAGRGLYVAEIPGGGALNPGRHLYEEIIYVFQGRGLTEVWQEGGAKTTFEWGTGSLFSLPLNTWHRLVNGSREPVVFLAITTAPEVMNALYDSEFVFNCDHVFLDRFGGQSGFYTPGKDWKKVGKWTTIWETNFIPDARSELLAPEEHKVASGGLIGYRMGGGFGGHISQWPSGIYHKAHYHGPGAVLIGITGKGYVPLWSHELGTRPYQDGHGDQVLEVEWGPGSIYTPPDGWYHQHMCISKEPARHVALYGGRVVTPDEDPILLVPKIGRAHV